jgi:hypothetical protein
MNLIDEAILKDEFGDFLFGRNKYFVLNIDWGGHDISYTINKIEVYLKSTDRLVDNDMLFRKIEKEYIKGLNNINLSIQDYSSIVAMIKLYCIWKFEECLKIDWIISEELIIKLNQANQKFIKQNSELIQVIHDNLFIIENRFGIKLVNLD